MKYKKGDIVRIIAQKHGYRFKIGSKVKIKEVRENDDYDASYINGHSSWYIRDNEVESIKK